MKVFALAALAVVVCAGSARASVLGSFLVKGPQGSPIINELNDSNREYIEKVGADMTRFEVGDKVHLYLDFDTIQSFDGPPKTFGGDALDAANVGGSGYNLLAKGTFTVSSIGPIVAGRANFGFTGEVVFYEKLADPGLVPFTTISAANAILSASTEIFRMGTADADDFIRALNAPVAFAAIPGPEQTAVLAEYGLSLTSGGGDLGIASNFLTGATGNKHDFVGTVNAFSDLSPGNSLGDNFFDLSTDARLLLAAQVPEPASMLTLAGLAAFGLGLRRNRKS